LEKAKIVAEKIRGIIEDYNFKNGLKVTISLGVGEYKSNENIDYLIIRLDKAMLEAKSKGRNRIISA
jgi:PleD family two-component response regulator